MSSIALDIVNFIGFSRFVACRRGTGNVLLQPQFVAVAASAAPCKFTVQLSLPLISWRRGKMRRRHTVQVEAGLNGNGGRRTVGTYGRAAGRASSCQLAT